MKGKYNFPFYVSEIVHKRKLKQRDTKIDNLILQKGCMHRPHYKNQQCFISKLLNTGRPIIMSMRSHLAIANRGMSHAIVLTLYMDI